MAVALALSGAAPAAQLPAPLAIQARGVKKRFVTRTGMPIDWGMGAGHWIISTLVKYRKEKRWHQAVDGVDLHVHRGCRGMYWRWR